MFRDLWFWLWLATLIIAWWLCVTAWHFRWLAKRRPPLLPTVTKDTMTIVHLRLALRRCVILMGDHALNVRISEGQAADALDVVDRAKALLVGTDFEIPRGA